MGIKHTPPPYSIELIRPIRESTADMVIGDRLSASYFTENKRPFHNFGNRFVRWSVNLLFHSDISDIMTGYRAFSYAFVKSFPVLSRGFEIETEMSIHAIDKKMRVKSVAVPYRDRPAGSKSKLNTYSDGWRVIRTVVRLFRIYRPMAFFGTIALLLFALATAFFLPILLNYFRTGFVPQFPTLIVCGFATIAAIESLFAGLVLETLRQKDLQDFEFHLNQIRRQFQRDLERQRRYDKKVTS